jgi:hypothetical protein
MNEDIILRAIPSTEPASFGEFCNELGADKPDCRDDWAILFKLLDKLEHDGLVTIDRLGRRVDSLILTDAGADRVRSLRR